jgi:pimeloyl-ACP methyl ester carboxylesterase
MGGWVALELAKRGRALSVTLLSPAGFYNVAEAAFVWASLWVSVRGARVLTNHAERVMSSKLRQSLLLAQFLGAPWKVSSVDAARMLMDLAACEGFDLDLPAIIRQRFIYAPGFSAPVTIAWGARDRLLFSRQQRRAAEEIPGSRMIRMPRVGHVPMHDDPALVADLLLRGSAPTGRPQL